jgi:cytochrome c oxidase subunit 2
MSLAQNGERLFTTLGCANCHSGDAVARGPNLAGAFGSRLTLTNGGSATVDEAFLRESILDPSTHGVAGYSQIMPTYRGQVSEDGIISLVEYIKNLKTNYRVQQTLAGAATTEAGTGAASTVKANGAAPAAGMVKP